MQQMIEVGLNTSDASRDYILLDRGDREALAGSLDRSPTTECEPDADSSARQSTSTALVSTSH